MSGNLAIMAPEEADISRFLTGGTHIGSTNVNYQMQQYVWKRRPSDGINIINIKKTYEKLLLAARAIAAIENPADVFVISSRPMGQRAVLKYARYTGATPIAGRFTPGAFTNQIQAAFREPRLLVITDPMQDHQPVNEASYVNIPVIAFCNTDSPLRFVDIAIPSNNKSAQSVGLMWWMLAREVLRIRGSIARTSPWEASVMPDLFFYRDPEEQEKEESAKAEESGKTEQVVEVIPEETAVPEEPAGLGTTVATGGAPAAAGAVANPVAEATAPATAAAKTDWSGDAADWSNAASSQDWGGEASQW